MTNTEIGEWRRVASDSRVSAMSRLHAIDTLAAHGNVYIVNADDGNPRRWDTTHICKEYRPVGTRARQAVVSLLRKLPDSQRRRERLLFIRGEEFYERGRVNFRERIFRLKSPEERLQEQTKPEQPRPAVVLELEGILAKYRCEEKVDAS